MTFKLYTDYNICVCCYSNPLDNIVKSPKTTFKFMYEMNLYITIINLFL